MALLFLFNTFEGLYRIRTEQTILSEEAALKIHIYVVYLSE